MFNESENCDNCLLKFDLIIWILIILLVIMIGLVPLFFIEGPKRPVVDRPFQLPYMEGNVDVKSN